MVAQSPPYALQNSSHSAAVFRQATFSAWRNATGTVGPNDLRVTAQSTPNMSIVLGAGRAWMKGTQLANVSGGAWSPQAAYFGINDAPVSLSIAAADPTNPRIDIVVAYTLDAYYSGASNTFLLAVVTGTPAASPSAPAAPNNALVCGTVAVAANATSVVSANIANTAGLMSVARGGILPVTSSSRPTVDLYGGLPIFETDTGRTYVWNPLLGASGLWDQVAGPPEVYTMASFTASFQSGTSGAYRSLTILKRGRDCWFAGQIARTGTAGITANTTSQFGTLPTAVTPSGGVQQPVSYYTGTGVTFAAAIGIVLADGTASVNPSAASSAAWSFDLSGVRWRTNN